MPYIQRNRKGELIGIYAVQQENADDFLEEDHPDIIEYYKKYPAPDELLRPLNSEEIKKIHKQFEKNSEEYKKLGELVIAFMNKWHELELSLCSLFYQIINPNPKAVNLAHTIYFTQQGFGTRTNLIKNVVDQFLKDNEDLCELKAPFKKLFDRLETIKKTRDTIAHGHIYALNANGMSDVKIRAPAFDILRVNNKINDQRLPGISSSDLSRDIIKTSTTADLVDTFNQIIKSFYEEFIDHNAIKDLITKIQRN